MFLVPVSGKIGWKNPPAVTLALLVINCLVFFLFQFEDNQSVAFAYGLRPAYPG